ncbi:hypothetical protein SS50377_22907 [Spironucleus salmonicida]|uniref:Uncharacterized protein n=1 Tax=Spironucleus salmonicida TaxID=348837 RepID=A0A9P8LW05_9EUKA|nr:hypothetical protein SS50377_22907 [Spironucleus salmonicida]
MNYIPKKTTTPLTQTLQLGDTGVYMPQQVDKYDQQSKRMQTLVSKLSKSQQVRTQSPQRMTLPQNSLVQKSLKNSPNVDFVPKKIGYVKVQQITSKIKEPPEEPHQQFQFCQNLDKYLVRQHKNSVDISLIKNDLKQTLDIDDCLDSNEENKDWIPNQIKQIQPNVAINTQKQVKGRFAGQLTHADSCQQNQLDIMQMAAQAASENLDGEQGTDINTLHETKHQPREANSRLAQAKNKDELDMEPSDANIEDAPPKSSAVTKSRYANHAQPDDDEDDEEPVSTPVHASQQKQEVPRGVRNLGLQHADSCQQNQMDIMRDAALASAREMDAQGAADQQDQKDYQVINSNGTAQHSKNSDQLNSDAYHPDKSSQNQTNQKINSRQSNMRGGRSLQLQHADSCTQNQQELFDIANSIQNEATQGEHNKITSVIQQPQKQAKGRFAGQLTHADSCQQNQLDIMQMAAQAASENLDGEQGTDINTLHETKHQPREANSRLAQAKNKDELDMEPSDANIEDAPPKSSAVTKSRYANHAQPDDDEDDEEPVSTPVHASQQKQEVPRGVRNLGLQHADSCQQNQMDIMRDAALASAREMDAQGAAGKNVKTTDLSNLGESSDISDIQLQTTEPQKLTQQRLKLNVPVFGETSSRFKNQQTVDDIQEEETASESDEAETYLPPQHLAKTNRNNLMLQHVDSYTQNQFEVFQIAQQIQNDSESFKNRKSALTNRENSNSAQQEAPKIAKRERLSRQLSHQDSCTQNQFEILSAASQILMDAELKSARGYKPNSIISHVGAEKVIPVRFGGSLQHMDSCTEDQRSILQMAEEIQSKEYNNESALSVRDFKYHDRKQNILVDSNAGLSALGTGIKPVQSGLLSQMLTQVGDSDQAFQRPEYLTDTGSFNLQREVLKCDGGFNK